jgi:hypothetical protein
MTPVTHSYHVSPDAFQALATKVAAETGLTIAGNTGKDSAKGITIGWDYQPDAYILSITLLGREFFDPAADNIMLRMDAFVAEVAGE